MSKIDSKCKNTALLAQLNRYDFVCIMELHKLTEICAVILFFWKKTMFGVICSKQIVFPFP